MFDNGCTLEFVEVKDTDNPAKMKYRYQYMNIEKQEIFRYNNAPHHRHLPNFPHHKHTDQQVISCQEPTLFESILGNCTVSTNRKPPGRAHREGSGEGSGLTPRMNGDQERRAGKLVAGTQVQLRPPFLARYARRYAVEPTEALRQITLRPYEARVYRLR